MISIESGGGTVKIIIPIPESEKKLVFETEEIRVIDSLVNELKINPMGMMPGERG